jgi:chromatin remodeling complex protein RSC6
MPRKSSTTKTEKTSKKSKNDSVKEEETVVIETPREELIEEEVEHVESTVEVEAPVGEETTPDKPVDVVDSFDELIKLVDDEIESIRTSQNKNTGVKFLRTLNKRLKLLKNKTSKAIKSRKSTRKPSNNTNSGFLKPVQISKEMSKFTGWESNFPRSRVDVTKFICKYIKDNELQNPKDRREILADDKLKKLLNYDPKKDDKPLTYYKIQSYLKPHFTPVEVKV